MPAPIKPSVCTCYPLIMIDALPERPKKASKKIFLFTVSAVFRSKRGDI
ncbi:hypothetical protein C1O63_1267 [Dehalococcoides mccartyi]|nr:hypothetical protein C1O63_1267 [Dehalococcoides mccartyi]